MATYQITGIVLGRTNFGEADRVIRLLTAERGKISVVARGVRKIKSRQAGHLELFGEVDLMLASGRHLDTITSARLRWYPHQLALDYARLSLAFSFSALINHLASEHQEQPELYAHFSEALRVIDHGDSGPLTELWFKLRLLHLSGYRPELEHCVVCGRRDADTTYHFDAGRGGLLCATDTTATAPAISHETIKLWRLLCDYPHSTIAHIAHGPALAEASLPLCHDFYQHHLGPIITATQTPSI